MTDWAETASSEKTACLFLTSRKRFLYFRSNERASDNRLKQRLSFEREITGMEMRFLYFSYRKETQIYV